MVYLVTRCGEDLERVFIRGLARERERVFIEASLGGVSGEIILSDKIYALAISTPYGCVVALGISLIEKSLGVRYLVLVLFNPLDNRDVDVLKKIIDSRELIISIDNQKEIPHKLSDEEVFKLEYVLNKTRECNLSMNTNIDLDKAFDWISSSFG